MAGFPRLNILADSDHSLYLFVSFIVFSHASLYDITLVALLVTLTHIGHGHGHLRLVHKALCFLCSNTLSVPIILRTLLRLSSPSNRQNRD